MPGKSAKAGKGIIIPEMIVERGEYKGNKMLVIKSSEEDRFPFQFGVKKAKKILAAIEEIKAFVEECGEESE